MDFIIVWIIFSTVAGVFAGTRGRSAFGWFFLSCVLSPLITIILIAILPRLGRSPKGLEAQLDEAQKLLTRGVITQEEYQSKRKAIIENN